MRKEYIVTVTVGTAIQFVVKASDEDEAELKALEKASEIISKNPKEVIKEVEPIEAEVIQEVLKFDPFEVEDGK